MLCALGMAAQVKITGKVVDESGQPIEFATVRVLGTQVGVNTDTKGLYELTVAAQDTLVVEFTCIGYAAVKRQLIKPQGTITLNPKLYEKTHELTELQVTEYKKQTNTMQGIDVESIRLTPDASGGSVEAVLTTMAGVSSKNEMSSQYMVRGGSYDENSVYINGIEVYRPQLISNGQQEGLSIINPDMVKSVNFSTGGFNAEYVTASPSRSRAVCRPVCKAAACRWVRAAASSHSCTASATSVTPRCWARWSRKASMTRSISIIRRTSCSSPPTSSRCRFWATCRLTTTASRP